MTAETPRGHVCTKEFDSSHPCGWKAEQCRSFEKQSGSAVHIYEYGGAVEGKLKLQRRRIARNKILGETTRRTSDV